jgi:hypothetical protein
MGKKNSEEKDEKIEGNTSVLTTITMLPGGGAQVDQVDHEEVRRRVQDLKARVEQDGWDLSVALHEVYDGALYQGWGFESWTDYVGKELEFQIRKAQYYVAVQTWVHAFAPDFVEWVKSCGLSKARLMSSRVTADEAALWRTRLDGKTYREMEALLKGMDPDDDGTGDGDGGGDGDGDSSGSGEKTTAMRFALFPAQHANVTQAIERAKEQGETDKDGHALDLICTDYLSSNGHFKDKEEYFLNIERIMGVRLVAFKAMAGRKDKIMFGGDFMDALIADLSEGEETDGDEDEDEDKDEKSKN